MIYPAILRRSILGICPVKIAHNPLWIKFHASSWSSTSMCIHPIIISPTISLYPWTKTLIVNSPVCIWCLFCVHSSRVPLGHGPDVSCFCLRRRVLVLRFEGEVTMPSACGNLARWDQTSKEFWISSKKNLDRHKKTEDFTNNDVDLTNTQGFDQ